MRHSLHKLAAVVLWSLAAPGLLLPINFNAPRSYFLGAGGPDARYSPAAFSLAVADFNGDGLPDVALAVVPYSPRGGGGIGRVEIFLAQSDGGFRHGANYSVSTPPLSVNSITAGDFNHDGKLDLALATLTGVSVLLGAGDGTFGPATVYPTPPGTYSIVAGDFNGDGNLDLATANNGSNNISILLGKGDGTFVSAVDYAVGVGAGYLAVADFNRDGKLDLAVTNANYNGSGSFSILYGIGDGTFRPAVNHSIASQPLSIAAGDFNRDGIPDLAITVQGSLLVLLGGGSGTFLPPVSVLTATAVNGVVVRDIDGDGILDLAVTTGNSTADAQLVSSYVSTLKGKGDGTFEKAQNYMAGEFVYSIAFGDFNADGKLDMAVACGAGGLSVLPNNGKGAYEQPVAQAAGSRPTAIATADFNGDGKPDLAVADFDSASVSILLGKGNSSFAPPVGYSVGPIPTSVVAGDFNGDGKIDVALGCGNHVAVLLGNGDGTFRPAVSTTVSWTTQLFAADFNGDGKLDLVTIDTTSELVVILFGNGDGTFRVSTISLGDAYGLFLGVGDMNNDGKPDLVLLTEECIGQYCGYVTQDWLGNGDGTFTTGPQISGTGFGLPVIADFNRDGNQDVATTEVWVASVVLGNGDATFQPALTTPAPGNVAAVGDFNGDGKLDIAGYGTGTAFILPGNGDGTFQTFKQFIAGNCESPQVTSVAVADFNGDGKPDLALTNACTDSVTILTNTTK